MQFIVFRDSGDSAWHLGGTRYVVAWGVLWQAILGSGAFLFVSLGLGASGGLVGLGLAGHDGGVGGVSAWVGPASWWGAVGCVAKARLGLWGLLWYCLLGLDT